MLKYAPISYLFSRLTLDVDILPTNHVSRLYALAHKIVTQYTYPRPSLRGRVQTTSHRTPHYMLITILIMECCWDVQVAVANTESD